MFKFCSNSSHRQSIGKKDDKDVINLVCPKCDEIYYVSDKRKKEVKKRNNYIIFFTLFTSIALFVWFKTDFIQNLNKKTPNSPENTIQSFFKEVNNQNFNKAYKYTNHAKWNSLSNFEKYLKNWKIYDVKQFTGKSYYSRYNADTIINVKYIGIEDKSLVREDRDYDFHLKRYNDEWKIVRLYLPRNPETDILKKEEIPKTAKNAVELFLKFLNEKLYKKAYMLSKNSSWGNEKKFTSSNGFGCITNINVYTIRKIKTINDNSEIIYAKYYAKDPCNKSETYEFYFYVSKESEYWKIINAKTEYE
jgi:hypothetical protein